MAARDGSPIDVIPSFFLEGGEGVSEYWRRNKSPVESRELANLLKAIRKITSFIGPNVGQIIWFGMKSLNEESEILLDPGLVLGRYPIPGDRTDIAIGTVINEAYRKIEWSDRVKTLIEKKLTKTTREKTIRLKMYIEMAEQIYLDIVSNRSILGLYTEKLRKYRFAEHRKRFTQPPTFDELVHIWWLMAADRSGTRYLEEFGDDVHAVWGFNLVSLYKESLNLLNSIIGELLNCHKITSLMDRCEYRANLYLSIWEQLNDITKYWITNIKESTFLPQAMDPGEIFDKESGDEAPLRSFLATIAEEIEIILQDNRDFTNEIRSICKGDGEVVPIKLSDIVLPLAEPIDNELIYKLYLTLKGYAKKRNLVSRGLKSGKIDSRRLYRASINGEIFCTKKTKHELDHDIVLLVDATGSMGGPKWSTIQKVFAAMSEAVWRLNQKARVFAYNEVKSTCFLTELSNKQGELYTILPQGKTASGEAIIATSLMLKSSNKKPFIIHLTDGASNWGTEVKNAIDYCRKKRIKLMTLGFGCEIANKAALREEYGNQVEFVDNLEELPRQLGKLLTHTFYM